jgi:hypothetical protein
MSTTLSSVASEEADGRDTAAFHKEEVLWFRVIENTFDSYMARQSAANKL